MKLLRKIIFKNAWKEEIRYTEGDVLWMGMGLRSEDMSLCKTIAINRFPGMCDLSHKT